MKSTAFWIGRFLLVLGATFALLAVVYILRGQAPAEAARDALMWAVLATSIFIGARYYQAHQKSACALCKDTVEN